jgi:hypothetical protein
MRKFLFLYLAVVCFLAVVGIFVFDGYLGVYDSATVKTGERTEEIKADSWQERSPHYISSRADQSVFFSYHVDNRWFTTRETTIAASLWQENQKVSDLISETREIKPFDRMTLDWTLDPTGLVLDKSQREQFTVRIEQNGTVREIITSFHNPETGLSGVKIPPPPERG